MCHLQHDHCIYYLGTVLYVYVCIYILPLSPAFNGLVVKVRCMSKNHSVVVSKSHKTQIF
jgi:hypothetical protein